MRGTRGGLLALAVGLATLALLGQNGGAATTPSALLLDPVGAFSAPTYIASPPGDTSRLVVVEQAGKIQLVLNGVVQATPFLDIHLLVSYDGNERGLFSIAFAPDYATSGLFYVYYTSTVGPGISRSTSSSATRATRTSPIRAHAGRSSPFRTQPSRITTAVNSSSAPTGCCTSVRETVAVGAISRITRRTCRSCSGRSCVSTPGRMGQIHTRFPPTIRSSASHRGNRKSGPTASGTLGASRSTASPATSTSGTSVRTPTRKSIISRSASVLGGE